MEYDGKHAKNSKFRLHFWPRIHFWRFGSPGYYYQLNWSTIAHLKSLVWTVFPASNPQDSLASEKSGAHTSIQSIRDQGPPSPAVRFLNPQDCRSRRQSSGYPIDLQWETEPAVNPMKDFPIKIQLIYGTNHLSFIGELGGHSAHGCCKFVWLNNVM